MPEQSIIVKHNVEMGHRLSLQPDSKCFQLHGHSWWVEVEIIGEVQEDGMILDFATAKRIVRTYLDNHFDHHLCLNAADPLLFCTHNGIAIGDDPEAWGVVIVGFDPTVENMARHWGEYFLKRFADCDVSIRLWEASSNAATWRNDRAET